MSSKSARRQAGDSKGGGERGRDPSPLRQETGRTAAKPGGEDAVTGQQAVPGLLGAVHRQVRRGWRRHQVEAALRRPANSSVE